MSDEEEVDHDAWSLLVPFTVTRSHGGPFDDDAYVAGYEAGQLAMLLAQWSPVVDLGVTIHTSNVPQVDLLAMQAGYTMEAEEWAEDPHWSLATFRRVGVLPPDAKETP